ncbi:MAG: L,D-transpeptidase [Legionella sp.]
MSAGFLSILAITAHATSIPVYYGVGLCDYPEYQCITVRSGQTWEKLFPNVQQRDLVQRINRSYNYLSPGKKIAVPRNLDQVGLLDLSPFPRKIINKEAEKQIIVDQEKLAWGAYSADGKLVNWGPISSGSDKCSDNSSPTCRTLTGIFHIFSKEDARCKSDLFPIGKGGAKMPYCMFFHKGLAMHGSNDLPGYRASHGCVRMFTNDAKWLNENFVELSNERDHVLGTKVVIRPLAPMAEKNKG